MTTPKPPTDPRPRVFRGGGWDCLVAAWVRADFRYAGAPAFRSGGLGFRCAQRGVRQPVGKVNP